MSVHAFDAVSGDEVWRTELAPADWAASWSGVTADADTVVIGAASDDLHLAALEAATGEVRWRHAGRDIAGLCATPVIDGDVVLAARAPGWLAAYALDDGAVHWEAPLDDAWPVALSVAGDLAVVRSSTGTVTAHAVDDGGIRWTCDLGPGLRAARPYSRAPGGARRPLIVVGDRVWTVTFDELVGIDLGRGEIVSTTGAGGELATVIADGDRVVAITTDAQVLRPRD